MSTEAEKCPCGGGPRSEIKKVSSNWVCKRCSSPFVMTVKQCPSCPPSTPAKGFCPPCVRLYRTEEDEKATEHLLADQEEKKADPLASVVAGLAITDPTPAGVEPKYASTKLGWSAAVKFDQSGVLEEEAMNQLIMCIGEEKQGGVTVAALVAFMKADVERICSDLESPNPSFHHTVVNTAVVFQAIADHADELIEAALAEKWIVCVKQ